MTGPSGPRGLRLSGERARHRPVVPICTVDAVFVARRGHPKHPPQDAGRRDLPVAAPHGAGARDAQPVAYRQGPGGASGPPRNIAYMVNRFWSDAGDAGAQRPHRADCAASLRGGSGEELRAVDSTSRRCRWRRQFLYMMWHLRNSTPDPGHRWLRECPAGDNARGAGAGPARSHGPRGPAAGRAQAVQVDQHGRGPRERLT